MNEVLTDLTGSLGDSFHRQRQLTVQLRRLLQAFWTLGCPDSRWNLWSLVLVHLFRGLRGWEAEGQSRKELVNGGLEARRRIFRQRADLRASENPTQARQSMHPRYSRTAFAFWFISEMVWGMRKPGKTQSFQCQVSVGFALPHWNLGFPWYSGEMSSELQKKKSHIPSLYLWLVFPLLVPGASTASLNLHPRGRYYLRINTAYLRSPRKHLLTYSHTNTHLCISCSTYWCDVLLARPNTA